MEAPGDRETLTSQCLHQGLAKEGRGLCDEQSGSSGLKWGFDMVKTVFCEVRWWELSRVEPKEGPLAKAGHGGYTPGSGSGTGKAEMGR